MGIYIKALAMVSFGLAALLGFAGTSSAQQSTITAVDILLEPDQTMLNHAAAANARLKKVFPKGFELDATHRPHITMIQRYVQTADLDKVYAAVDSVLASEKAAGWKLKAFKYYYLSWGEIGIAGIVIEPTDDLLRLQQRLIDAVAPFTARTGTVAAFASSEAVVISSPRYSTTWLTLCRLTVGRISTRMSPSGSPRRIT
jgi:hypothetical protein